MTYLYIIFSILGIFAECSQHIDTRNLFKKVGLAIIIVGSIVEIGGHPNDLIQFGAFSYIIADIWRKFKNGE